jgi:SAM-dependent methyltransferase
MDVQVAEGYYYRPKYTSLERFISYYYQLDAIRSAAPSSVLIVGPGDGIISGFLKRVPGLTVTTLDIDASLSPDVVGDARELPFPDGSFDVACAFEVLEHIPFDDSKRAMKELARVAKRRMIISVPHRRTGFEFVFKFPYIRSILKRDFVRIALLVPVRFPGFAVSKQHYWEIDGRTTKLADVRAALRATGRLLEERTAFLDPYRRFFVVGKGETMPAS